MMQVKRAYTVKVSNKYTLESDDKSTCRNIKIKSALHNLGIKHLNDQKRRLF